MKHILQFLFPSFALLLYMLHLHKLCLPPTFVRGSRDKELPPQRAWTEATVSCWEVRAVTRQGCSGVQGNYCSPAFVVHTKPEEPHKDGAVIGARQKPLGAKLWMKTYETQSQPGRPCFLVPWQSAQRSFRKLTCWCPNFFQWCLTLRWGSWLLLDPSQGLRTPYPWLHTGVLLWHDSQDTVGLKVPSFLIYPPHLCQSGKKWSVQLSSVGAFPLQFSRMSCRWAPVLCGGTSLGATYGESVVLPLRGECACVWERESLWFCGQIPQSLDLSSLCSWPWKERGPPPFFP